MKHFVYVSSASVTYPRRTRYAESKLAGEALVKAERRFAHTIVRPTLVYEDNGGQEFLLFQHYLERFPVVPFIGDGRARKRPVQAQDIVEGLAAIAGNPRSHGQTYNFSGADSVSIRELADLMLARRGQRRRFLHLPVGAVPGGGAGHGRGDERSRRCRCRPLPAWSTMPTFPRTRPSATWAIGPSACARGCRQA